jgi:hypothetical protein
MRKSLLRGSANRNRRILLKKGIYCIQLGGCIKEASWKTAKAGRGKQEVFSSHPGFLAERRHAAADFLNDAGNGLNILGFKSERIFNLFFYIV